MHIWQGCQCAVGTFYILCGFTSHVLLVCGIVGGIIKGLAKCGDGGFGITCWLQVCSSCTLLFLTINIQRPCLPSHFFPEPGCAWFIWRQAGSAWNAHTWKCEWTCVCVQALHLLNVFGEDAEWFQWHWPIKNESMQCIGRGGPSLSLSPSCPSFSSQSLPSCAPSQSRTLPPSPSHPTAGPFSPLSVPSPHSISQCLALKGRKNAKPAQISVIISFTGTGLMSQGGPGFACTKGPSKKLQLEGADHGLNAKNKRATCSKWNCI